MISLTGWTWEYIGQHLTLPRLYEMQRYWEQHPPVGDLVAAYLGYKPPGAGDPAGRPYGSPAELMAEFAALGGKVKSKK